LRMARSSRGDKRVSMLRPACRSFLVIGAGRRYRVLDVVPFEEEHESPFVGLLKVEALALRQ